jgi:hypothetical protein
MEREEECGEVLGYEGGRNTPKENKELSGRCLK